VCRTTVPLKKWQGGILLTRQEGVNAMRAMQSFSRENTDGLGALKVTQVTHHRKRIRCAERV
jgi:hypothetical protein